MKKTFFFLAAMALAVYSLHAQVNFNDYKVNGIYKFDDEFKLLKGDVFTTYKTQFGLTTDDEMIEDDEEFIETDFVDDISCGTLHTRYKQYYKEYPVEHRSMNVASKCGIVLVVGGNPVVGLNVDVSAPVNEASALATALGTINAPLGFTWQNADYELAMIACSEDTTGVADSSLTTYPTGELIIAKKYGQEYADDASNYGLCWKFQISYFDTVTIDSIAYDSTQTYNIYDTVIKYVTVYVNANNNTIWGSYDPMFGSWQNGDVWTFYHGQRTDMETYGNTGKFTLKDRRIVEAYKFDKGYYKDIVEENNSWVTWDEKENASAYWAAQQAYEYFKWEHNKPSKHQTILSTQNTSINNRGAAWRVAQVPFKKGEDEIAVQSGWAPFSFASLDIIGHEFTHAIINQSSQLGINTPYSEAHYLNEGFADIFGLCIESRVNGWVDWEYGEDYFSGIFKRRFNDPQNDFHPNGATGSAATYTDGNTLNYLPYSASGPLRRWFNHLSQGEWNWTPAYSGVGFWNAAHVAFLTMYYTLYSTSTYYDAAYWSLAVADLHYGGFCQPFWKKVERAWYDVGVINSFAQCKVWGLQVERVINPNIVGNSDKPVKFRVRTNLSEGETTAEISDVDHNWLVPAGWTGSISTDGSEFTLETIADNSSKVISVVVTYLEDSIPKSDTLSEAIHFSTACGTATKSSRTLTNSHPVPGMQEILSSQVEVYPNPASSYLNIGVPNVIKRAPLVITDMAGRVIHTASLHGGYNSVALPQLPNGVYLVRIKDDKMNVVKKVQIQQ